MILQRRQLAGTILRQVLNDTLDVSVAINQWPEDSEDELLSIGLHALHHYIDDADIRGRDEAYAQLQKQSLRLLVEALSNDLPLPDDWSYWQQ